LPRQTLVRVHPARSELESVYEPALAIVSALPAFAARVRTLEPVQPRWAEWTRAARADYLENLRNEPMEGALDVGAVMAHLRERLPPDAVQTCGAGNFTVWAHRFAEFRQYGTQLGPRSGAMGYGVPAAVAAKLLHPDRVVVCFTGDGDFVMSSPELATAVQYGLPIVILLVNNGMYATIRMHQERQYPQRVIGTDLRNPDFPELARAYGAYGERVERTEDFAGAFERALASGQPAVLELPVDPERISPRVKLSELRGEA
jgi:acetolactate synthase-1/2/3 large subunit